MRLLMDDIFGICVEKMVLHSSSSIASNDIVRKRARTSAGRIFRWLVEKPAVSPFRVAINLKFG
jgi:hypothetical protein